MATVKDARTKEAIREVASEFISRESNQQSMITVTRVELGDRGGKALIYVTVFPENKENAALSMLQRNRTEFRALIPKKIRIGRIPFVDFKIDEAAKLTRIIDGLPENK